MIKEKQERLNTLLAQADVIRLKYEGKAETMTAQEEQEWTSILDEADTLRASIDLAIRDQKTRDWAASVSTNALAMGGARSNGGKNRGEAGRDEGNATGSGEQTERERYNAMRKQAFALTLKGSMSRSPDENVRLARLHDELFQGAYQADVPSAGGFIVAPQQFVQDIILLMKDLVFVRKLATTYLIERSESLGIPALDVDPSDADWTSELATGNEEDTMKFGKRELRPSPNAKRVKLSNKLLRQAVIDPETLVRERLAYKFSVSEEKAFLTGSGADQPLGVFTASANGVPTSRDVTGNSAGVIKADDFIDCKYNLKAQYQARAQWILNRTIVQAARKLKDNNNNYIWSTALGPGTGFQGTPETLLDMPINMSEYAPNTVASGNYVGILGDWSRYVVATALDMQVQVLDQLYAETNQTGYIARMETDGMPVLAEAFSRMKVQ